MEKNTSLFRKKTVDQILKDANSGDSGHLARILGVRDLVSLGIAAIVGAGIFSTIGLLLCPTHNLLAPYQYQEALILTHMLLLANFSPGLLAGL